MAANISRSEKTLLVEKLLDEAKPALQKARNASFNDEPSHLSKAHRSLRRALEILDDVREERERVG